jgi:hypothetical protein
MVAWILLSQIVLQVIFQYAHSTEGYIVLFIAFTFCVAIAQARWCAMWAKHDDSEMRLERVEARVKNLYKGAANNRLRRDTRQTDRPSDETEDT